MSQEKHNPIKTEKMRKRLELLKKGVDPYPHKWKTKTNKGTTTNKILSSVQLLQNFEKLSLQEETTNPLNKKILFHAAGRLMRKRPMGKAAFFNIQDEEGEIQCYIRKDSFFKTAKTSLDEQDLSLIDRLEVPSLDTVPKSPPHKKRQAPNPWELWELCDIGDILGVSGELFKTKKGEISLRVTDLKILCKTLEVLPEKYHGLEDKELKYRYRHLDLIMNQKSREVFKIRSQIIQEIRAFMTREGFMEVETPVLQPLYGGDMAVPFETHFRRLNKKMYLRISPEIYLKKLIVGGFEKVFEIGKNFRNEGIDRSHNPEFNLMEYYQAYTDYEDQMKFFEKLVCYVTQKIKGSSSKTPDKVKNISQAKQGLKFLYQGKELDLSPPWIRISPREFEQLLYSRTKRFEQKDNSLSFEYKGKGWKDPESFFEEINKDIQKMKQKKGKTDFAKFWKLIASNKIDDKAQKEKLTNKKLLPKAKSKKEELLKIYKLLLNYIKYTDPKGDFEKFDNLLKQDNTLSVKKLFSYKEELCLAALELTVEKYFWNPVFIKDFPLQSSPLTKTHRKSKYKKELVERFEPYIAGMELGNAYTELNDPVDQRERLEKQERYTEKKIKLEKQKKLDQKEDEDQIIPQPIDENFLHALEVGMPPTGGVGLGIERLVMILSDQKNIRDSILFPILKDK